MDATDTMLLSERSQTPGRSLFLRPRTLTSSHHHATAWLKTGKVWVGYRVSEYVMLGYNDDRDQQREEGQVVGDRSLSLSSSSSHSSSLLLPLSPPS